MNIILILIDSLNKSALNIYQPTHIQTPNFDAFAARSLRFNNHFAGSLPCMPARREIFSGFKEVMWRPWGPLEPFDARLPKLLEQQGYATAVVTDHYHYWEEAANGYLQPFQSTTLVRGHELDNWKPLFAHEDLPQWIKNIERWRPEFGRRYYSNVKNFRHEEDFFPAKVFSNAAEWLEENARNQTPFYLHIESFDVHEPFDVPEPYASMYGEGTARDRFTLWPPYQDPELLSKFMHETSPEELAFIQAQYAGKLTMVDKWLGRLLSKLDELKLWEDTLVVITTDHGHDLGQRGQFGKQYPHFDSHANIPLLISHPDHSSARTTNALTSTVDLHATILAAAGIESRAPHSHSIMTTVNDPHHSDRSALTYGTFGQGICCTNGTWSLFKSPKGANQLFAYSTGIFDSLTEDTVHVPNNQGNYIPDVLLPQWRIPVTVKPRSRENHLYHRQRDPRQNENLWNKAGEEQGRMIRLMTELLQKEGAPYEQFERLGLSAML